MCIFCDLVSSELAQKKSRWFYWGDEAVVIEDIDSRGFKMRLLYIPRRHISSEAISTMQLVDAYSLTMALARAMPELLWKTAVWELGVGEHAHYWLCLR